MVMCPSSYWSLSYVLLLGLLFLNTIFRCIVLHVAGTLPDSVSLTTTGDENGLRLIPYDEGAFLANLYDINRKDAILATHISGNLQVCVQFGHIINVLEGIIWSWKCAWSILRKRPKLNAKRRILFVFVAHWYGIAGSDWHLWFDYELVVNDWFCSCCMWLEIKILGGLDDDGSKLFLPPCFLISFVVWFHNSCSILCLKKCCFTPQGTSLISYFLLFMNCDL